MFSTRFASNFVIVSGMALIFACLVLQQVNRLEVTPDKQYLAAAGNPHIRLYDVNSNHPQPVCSSCLRLSNIFLFL